LRRLRQETVVVMTSINNDPPDPGAHHEKSPSRLRQRSKWKSHPYWHDRCPSQQGQTLSKGTPGESAFG
jgi:hypothetical protein